MLNGALMRRPFPGCLTIAAVVAVTFTLMYVFVSLLAAGLGGIIP